MLWFIGTLYEKLRNREGLGFGDVKMVGMIAAFEGLGPALLTVVVGSVLGSVCGILYVFITKKDASTYELPFGSFLGIAALFVAVWVRLTQ
jgi:leader peptidase (prepilin peptidase)/N-methyltransferase